MSPGGLALRRAEALIRAGNFPAAIEPLREALTDDPEQALAHLLLARCLRAQHRLAGARWEAERSIALAPLEGAGHIELALTLALEQKHKAALVEADVALALDPGDPFAHLVRARLLRLGGKREAARASLARALEAAPGEPAIIAEQGHAALERGAIDEVDAAGRAILAGNPDDADALILIGHAQLARGDTEEALRLALTALANAPTDPDALGLLASIKMKRSLIGGLWWRWNRLLVRLGQSRAIFLVVGLWVVYRWSILGTRDLGLPDGTDLMLTALYLGFVVYTISADAIVSRMIRKEVERVRLRPSF